MTAPLAPEDRLHVALSRMTALFVSSTELEGPDLLSAELAFLDAGRDAVRAWADLIVAGHGWPLHPKHGAASTDVTETTKETI